jgi:hypothetical protein
MSSDGIERLFYCIFRGLCQAVSVISRHPAPLPQHLFHRKMCPNMCPAFSARLSGGMPPSPAARHTMKVLVCGGRQYDDAATLGSRLEEIHRDHGITVIIEGGAAGADTLARKFAERRGIPVRTFPADWGTHGRAAGPIRTARCLRKESPILLLPSPAGQARPIW